MDRKERSIQKPRVLKELEGDADQIRIIFMISYPQKVVITEVGPRDGLQNEKEVLSTQDKINFIDDLGRAGLPRIEITSFVNPQRVPQMADSSELARQIRKKPHTRLIALVPNLKGLEKAIDCRVDSVALFTAASESFTQKNINRTIEESLTDFKEIIKTAKAHGLWIRGYISTVFGCPYEGKISIQKVEEVTQRFLDLEIDELSLGDTIGVATPNQVWELISQIEKICPLDKIALHFHDTRGTALANVLAGLETGIYKFDSSAGGLGGCPYAPGAAGNLATEDLVYMLQGMKIETGVDLEKVVQASQKLSKILNRRLPSRYLQTSHLPK